MTILLYCIGAALLVLTGAVVSGGLRLPQRQPKGERAGRDAGGRAQPRPRRADGVWTGGGLTDAV